MSRNIMKTFSATPKDITRKWYVIDATDLVLGRMSSIIANYLRGKNKPYFTPHMDCGDYIIVINADKVHLTGHKYDYKMYYNHSGYPGGLRERHVQDLLSSSNPGELIELSVKRMIGRTPLGRKVLKKLFVYAGSDHKHEAQKPEILDIASMNPKNKKRK